MSRVHLATVIAASRRSADWQSAVSPIGNRPPVARPRVMAGSTPGGLPIRDTADCQRPACNVRCRLLAARGSLGQNRWPGKLVVKLALTSVLSPGRGFHLGTFSEPSPTGSTNPAARLFSRRGNRFSFSLGEKAGMRASVITDFSGPPIPWLIAVSTSLLKTHSPNFNQVVGNNQTARRHHFKITDNLLRL